MTHELKCWPPYFQAMKNGAKRFELRKDDRDYQIGDALLLREWDCGTSSYTGDEINRHVAYILRDAEPFGLRQGYCILGFYLP